MSWDIKYDAAMAEAKRSNICPEDAETMWQKYNELGDAVRARTDRRCCAEDVRRVLQESGDGAEGAHADVADWT